MPRVVGKLTDLSVLWRSETNQLSELVSTQALTSTSGLIRRQTAMSSDSL
ncbi:MAG: hypothetical protein J07HX5_01652 [halophilic archaeon J07HX5]|nr:MAG: hypothetical protein J07HX5_01652 [halophilic archaeon J07HX5]